jgi:hypothetical protein
MAIYEILDGSRVHECTCMMPTLSALVNGVCRIPFYAICNLRRQSTCFYLNNPKSRRRPVTKFLPGFL